MIHLKLFISASRNAREWQAFVEYFVLPSLDMLRYVVPLHKPRKLTDNSSVDLAVDIVKLNPSSIHDLYDVPIWKLSEPLPTLHLELFTYAPRSWDNDLSNLSGCVVDELEVYLEQGSPEDQISLDVLAAFNSKKIVFHAGFADLGQFSAVEGTTNRHVLHVGFELDRISVDVQDIEALRHFLPNLGSIQIDAVLRIRKRGREVPSLTELQQIGQYLASDRSMPLLRGLVTLKFLPDLEETVGANM